MRLLYGRTLDVCSSARVMEHGRANTLIGEPFQHSVQWSPKQAFRSLVSGDSNYRPQRSMAQLNEILRRRRSSASTDFLVRLDSKTKTRTGRPSDREGKRGSAFPRLRQDRHFRRRDSGSPTDEGHNEGVSAKERCR